MHHHGKPRLHSTSHEGPRPPALKQHPRGGRTAHRSPGYWPRWTGANEEEAQAKLRLRARAAGRPSSLAAATDNAGLPQGLLGLLRGGLFLCLLAPAPLLLALVFVGFGLRLCRNGLTLAVLAQVRVRLALAPVPGVADRLPPVVGELLPAVRADRSPRLPLSGLPFPTAPFLFPSGLATAGEVGVPAGVTDRVKQRLAAVAAEAPALSFGWLFYWGAVCDDHSDRRPRLGGDGPFLVDRENERLIRTATSIPVARQVADYEHRLRREAHARNVAAKRAAHQP